ncbi:MAG: glutamine synthetase III [Eubacteriales bacterium]
MSHIPEYFGELVFDRACMKARLPKEIYDSLLVTMEEGKPLESGVAHVVANAMKDWAIEKGATHFTHWFQPMTSITAEKHDSFISPTPEGKIIMEFSGKELIKGEPDASSFPSGGLRSTFEARGYTAWDPTSYAFIKGNALCIPTAFCAYSGVALDKKTPLLRSMEAVNKQALRVLHLFGHETVHAVKATVGPEQEYFLVDRALFDRRRDLLFAGRTLFGGRPPKGQEMEDHYYGAIKPRVAAFMEELDEQLWRLGIFAKTEHNEVAPGQHELAPVFTTANIATDHNQLTMEMMQTVARKHGLVCLLHEKPFAHVNGSGKHNNWSLATNTGVNLLSPGETPHENAQFLLFLCAVIQAVDDYQDLLRISVATAGNDHRLGANEAPPAVVSLYLGDELTGVLQAIETGCAYNGCGKTKLQLGVDALPRLPKDSTDRNRTSPFAFTGNKFEFRMLGSSNSIACPNIMLNTAVAESLRQYADKLEGAADFQASLQELIRSTIKAHRRIIFNGNGYDEAWIREATEQRGLLNLKTTPECLPYILLEKNIALFERHKVFSPIEVHARYEINLENYCKVLHIELLTMIDMARKEILPALCASMKDLAETGAAKKALSASLETAYEEKTLRRLSALTDEIDTRTEALESAIRHIKNNHPLPSNGKSLPASLPAGSPTEHGKALQALADAYRLQISPLMQSLREAVDEAETLTARRHWPFPTYAELMFSVN